MEPATAALCFLIASLPALLFLGHRLLQARAGGVSAGQRFESEAQTALRTALLQARDAGVTAGQRSVRAQTVLRGARRSAAERRLRVSGLMAQSGWALSVFGGDQ